MTTNIHDDMGRTRDADSGSALPAGSFSSPILPPRLPEFLSLFDQFVQTYLPSFDLGWYERGREEGRRNFQEAVSAMERGSDELTEIVLWKLIPHEDNKLSRRHGAWLHIAPSGVMDIRASIEGSRQVRPEDWPRICPFIITFIQRCAESADALPIACEEYAASPLSKGFQSGMISPILNALRPDDYFLINKKPVMVLHWLTGQKQSQRIAGYPATNATLRGVIENARPKLTEILGREKNLFDVFDHFCHWMVAELRYFKGTEDGASEGKRGREGLGAIATGGKAKRAGQKATDSGPRFWKIAPEIGGRLWDLWREKGVATIGWDRLGDLTGADQKEFQRKLAAIRSNPPEPGWNGNGPKQVWLFRGIGAGDRIIANLGKKKIIGVGTVVSPYFYEKDTEHSHRIRVRWDDTTERDVAQQPKWQRTLVRLKKKEFETLTGISEWSDREAATGDGTADGRSESTGLALDPDCPFSARTFELLSSVASTPTMDFYRSHRDAFVADLEKPFQSFLRHIADDLPEAMRASLETEKNLFSRIPKNDYGRGGAWPYYWGALYPKGGHRTRDAQLFIYVDDQTLNYGFYVGEYGAEARERFLRNVRQHRTEIEPILQKTLDRSFGFGSTGDLHRAFAASGPEGLTRWLSDPARIGIRVGVNLTPAEVLAETLSAEINSRFSDLYPLVLLASRDDPLPAIEEYLELAPEETVEPQPAYPLEQFEHETGFDATTLSRWVAAIRRKGQAVLYGPPGTGKTFVAERLARHLVGGGVGFTELIQFHPAYAYEDFVQGIRPRTNQDGSLTYDIAKGRFLSFCDRAARTSDPCVLIIDEINRANLARVFGELMYLLEYRDQEVPLAGGGRLRIPSNVLLIGTMNTADRSIALVDHALRRRFAFLHLPPSYEALRRFLASTGRAGDGSGRVADKPAPFTSANGRIDPDRLIDTLRWVNTQIGDPHYEVGVSFFMRKELGSDIEDIWRMEIEPYLEEYFFDQPEKTRSMRWDEVRPRVFK